MIRHQSGNFLVFVNKINRLSGITQTMQEGLDKSPTLLQSICQNFHGQDFRVGKFSGLPGKLPVTNESASQIFTDFLLDGSLR